MGTVTVLKEVEKFNQEDSSAIISFQVPAIVLDFNQKFQSNLQNKKIQKRALDGIQALEVIVNDYEEMMNDLALKVTPDQLAQVTELSANEQISEDLRRLKSLIETLKCKVSAHKGLTLQGAFNEIKSEINTELGAVAEYLEKNEYVLFQVMMKVIAWSSESPEAIESEEFELLVSHLNEMGAFDTANALYFISMPE